MALKLPINAFSWQSTLTRWATELRSQFFLSEKDFMTPQRWEPSVTSSNPVMTISAVQVDGAKFLRVGDMVWFSCRIPSFTTAGAGAGAVVISAPVTADIEPARLENESVFAARVSDGGANISGYGYLGPDGNIGVTRYDGAIWGIGAGRAIVVSGIYKALS